MILKKLCGFLKMLHLAKCFVKLNVSVSGNANIKINIEVNSEHSKYSTLSKF